MFNYLIFNKPKLHIFDSAILIYLCSSITHTHTHHISYESLPNANDIYKPSISANLTHQKY